MSSTTSVLANSGAETVSEPVDDVTEWVMVCELDKLHIERGVAALVHGRPVAVFAIEAPESPLGGARSGDVEVFAIDHIDPRSNAPTMARGIIGSHDGEPTVAAPLLKERYSLVTGHGLGGHDYSIDTFEVQIVDGWVQVR